MAFLLLTVRDTGMVQYGWQGPKQAGLCQAESQASRGYGYPNLGHPLGAGGGTLKHTSRLRLSG